jgi:hypothetical protein
MLKAKVVSGPKILRGGGEPVSLDGKTGGLHRPILITS